MLWPVFLPSRKLHVIPNCGGSLVGEDASTVMPQMSHCKHGRGFHGPFSGNVVLGARNGKHGSLWRLSHSSSGQKPPLKEPVIPV